jgi:uncharacterized membrane protein YecN with MAPEG domain
MFNILKKDNLWLGVFYAFLIPAILFSALLIPVLYKGGAITWSVFENTALFIIAANAVAMNWGFFQNERDETGRGMFITTGIFAFAYIVYFYVLQ